MYFPHFLSATKQTAIQKRNASQNPKGNKKNQTDIKFENSKYHTPEKLEYHKQQETKKKKKEKIDNRQR